MKQYTRGGLSPRMKALRGKMAFNAFSMVKSALEAYLRPERVLSAYRSALPEENRRVDAFSGEGMSLHARAAALSGLLRFFYGDYGIPMILAAQIAYRRIKGLFKHEAARVRDHLINLGIALPGNKTTEMGEEMYGLASAPELVRFDDAAAFLAALERGSVAPDFARRWERFLEEFGMRCPGEVDPATPRPVERPARLFELLKAMSPAVDGTRSFFDDARAKREAAYRALYACALEKGKRRARALEKNYKIWLAFGGYRETPKHYAIKVTNLFRRQALAMARAFFAAGRLDAPERIFDLTIDDVDRALADPALDLRSLARERSALIEKIKKSRLTARVIDSRGKIFAPPPMKTGDGEFIGVPISPGVARGKVRVIRRADVERLFPGEILVARAADPGWTPLFINAGGIVLEIGGALQHGAVVAREYGIPCVSGLDDATALLKDGQTVEVDGSNGIVRILE
jgi:phosphohistidine swiveling domain-containing protein